MDGNALSSIANIGSAISSTATELFKMTGDVIDKIADTPILLFVCVGLPLFGIGIGLIKRLLRVKF